jgi:hypothetical protein
MVESWSDEVAKVDGGRLARHSRVVEGVTVEHAPKQRIGSAPRHHAQIRPKTQFADGNDFSLMVIAWLV